MIYEVPTTYTVCALPMSAGMSFFNFAITVELTHHDPEAWAVRQRGWCLSRDGQWEYEPTPSSRTPSWLYGHRFTLEEALEMARSEAPHVTVNDVTVDQMRLRLGL